MTLNIELPPDVESALRLQLGKSLEQRAVEDLAAAWFSEGRLTSRQVASLLGVSLFEGHAFLKSRGASIPMSLGEIEADVASLRELHGK